MLNHSTLLRSTRPLLQVAALCGIALYATGAIAAEGDAGSDGADGKATEIKVIGRSAGVVEVGGALGGRSVLDTPLSIATVSRDELADRGVASLGQVFAQDASVMSQGDTNTIYSSHISVRGLQLDETNGYKINGLPIYNFGIELPLAFFDSVELLKGATGFMYGFGAPGGIVNYVTAKPTAETHLSADVGFRSDSIWSQHLDVGGGLAGGRLGYRVNLVHEDGEAPNGARVNNRAAAVSLVAHLAPNLDWTADGIYQKRKTNDIVQGIGTAFYADTVLPKAPGGSHHLPATDGSYFNTNYYFASSGLHWQVAPDWKISADVSRSGNTRRFSFDFDYLTDRSGDFIDYVNDSRSRNRFDQGQLIAEGTVRTGPLTHQIVVGASVQKELSFGNVNQVFTSIGTSNIYTGSSLTYDSTMTVDEYKSASFLQKSLFASDTVTIAKGLSLLAGIRWTDYEQRGFSSTGSGAEVSAYRKKPVTPTFALLYKPTPTTTLYASYVESLEQGTTVDSTYANHDALLSPIRSKQYEIGAKIEQPLWSGSAALFAVRRGIGYANAANEYVQNGYALYKGLDLNGRLRPAPNWSVGGSLLWLHAEYDKADAGVEGNRLEGTPKIQLAGDVTYGLPAVPGLSLNANVRYNGNETVDSAAQLKISGYALVGLGARYTTTVADRSLILRANVSNLANKHYWYYIQSGYIFPGTSRAVSLSAQIAL